MSASNRSNNGAGMDRRNFLGKVAATSAITVGASKLGAGSDVISHSESAIAKEIEQMGDVVKIGIIICDRYRTCGGGKCYRSLNNREGAFSLYKDKKIEVVGHTTCDGCPGGNIEYVPAEMKRNGVEVIHLTTGVLVGYPPCPYIDHFVDFIEKKYGIKVVVGTHPIPQSYVETHKQLGTFDSPEWSKMVELVMADEQTRIAYNS